MIREGETRSDLQSSLVTLVHKLKVPQSLKTAALHSKGWFTAL